MYKSLYNGKRRRSRQKNILLLRLFQIGKLKKKVAKRLFIAKQKKIEYLQDIGNLCYFEKCDDIRKKMKNVIYWHKERMKIDLIIKNTGEKVGH